MILFAGGSLEGHNFPGAEATTSMWATYDGCAARGELTDERVDADLADEGRPAETTVTRWTGCEPGGAVELWTIPGGSHVPSISDAFAGEVLDFLGAHPKR